MEALFERAKPRNHNSKWSKGQENGLIKHLKSGKQDSEIAKLFGRSVGSICEKKKTIARRLFEDGVDIDELAGIFRLRQNVINPNKIIFKESCSTKNTTEKRNGLPTNPKNHGQRWDTIAEDSILIGIKNNATDLEIGVTLGRTEGSIASKKRQMARLRFENGQNLESLCELFNLHHDDINPLPWSDDELLKACSALAEGQCNAEVQMSLDRCEVSIKSARFKFNKAVDLLNDKQSVENVTSKTKLSETVVKLIQQLVESGNITIPLSQISSINPRIIPVPQLNFNEESKFVAIHFKMQGQTFAEHFSKTKIFDTEVEANAYKAQHSNEMIFIVRSSED